MVACDSPGGATQRGATQGGATQGGATGREKPGRQAGRLPGSAWGHTLISQKVFKRSFCKSQFPHKFVNLFCTLVIQKDKLTDSCGN